MSSLLVPPSSPLPLDDVGQSKKPPPKQEEWLDETTLATLVSTEDRKAYQEALTRAPKVVASETPWSRFVAADKDHNPKRAALTLCRYWTERRDIFGDDRAFRPMDQTGRGALCEADIEIFNETALVVVPEKCDLFQSRSCMVIDIERLDSKYNYAFFYACKLRMTFYVIHVTCENPITQSVGIAAIGVMSAAPDVELSKRSMNLLQHAFPMRDFQYHVVFLPSRLESLSLSSYIEDILALVLQLLGFFSSRSVVHRGKTDQEVIKSLVACGFNKRFLPTWIGGSWTMGQFKTWQKNRIRLEEERTMTNEEKQARIRQSNVIRSRRKRERRKQEFMSLQEQQQTLLAENKKLKETNQHLEQLMVYAQQEVFILSEIPGDSVAPASVDQTLIPTQHTETCSCNDCLPYDESMMMATEISTILPHPQDTSESDC